MHSKLRETLKQEEIIKASQQKPSAKLKEALELSQLCFELKKATLKKENG